MNNQYGIVEGVASPREGAFICQVDMANQSRVEIDLKACIVDGGFSIDWYLELDPKFKSLKTDKMMISEQLWSTNETLRSIKVMHST